MADAAKTRRSKAHAKAQSRQDLIREIEERRKSRVICLFTSDRLNAQGQFAKDFLPKLFSFFDDKPLEQLDIVLFTLGGDTLAAYALNRFLRQMAQRINVLIPHWCHSAGTLFALGANELVMTKLGTLSAIDPSIIGPLNPFIEPAPGAKQPVPVGVESVAGFRNLVREEWRLDDEGASEAFGILAEKINPILLGDLFRSREQIISLATTLLNLHASEPDKTKKIVQTLAKGLGSHDYLVMRAEARDLGLPVAKDDPELEDLIWRLYESFAAEMKLGEPVDLGVMIQDAVANATPFPLRETLKIVILESSDHKEVWERELIIPMPPTQPQTIWNCWR